MICKKMIDHTFLKTAIMGLQSGFTKRSIYMSHHPLSANFVKIRQQRSFIRRKVWQLDPPIASCKIFFQIFFVTTPTVLFQYKYQTKSILADLYKYLYNLI